MGIVPEDVVTLSVSPFSSCSGFVVYSVVVSAFVECFLVWGGGGVAWSNDALSDERDDSRLLMPAGMFFVVTGGCCSPIFKTRNGESGNGNGERGTGNL